MSAPMTSAIGESVERLLARLGGSEAASDGAGEDAAILIGADRETQALRLRWNASRRQNCDADAP